MCGIAGIFNYRLDEAPDPGQVRRMMATLTHRGPDDEGVYASEQVVLGHQRLSIIDLVEGRQPLANEDASIWVIFNGEIYNFTELRRRLVARGHQFATQTDTEALVHEYEDRGVDLVGDLRGMFAFAIWDERRHELMLARDRFGKKPLYIAEGKGRIAFASEMKALLVLPWVDRTWNASALRAYLSLGHIPSTMTAYNGIRKMLPGTVELWCGDPVQPRGLSRSWRYWQPSAVPCDPMPTYDEACYELAERLRESVQIRLRSDVPLGAFLSGGVDSTCVVALMRACGVEDLKTFSIGFESEGGSDVPFAEEAARALGTEHRSAVHTAADALVLLPELLDMFDEPFADTSALPTFLVSRLARQHVTVALSGDGGDELFAGYAQYAAFDHYRTIDKIPRGAQRLARAVGTRLLPPGARGARFVRMLDVPANQRGLRFAHKVEELSIARLVGTEMGAFLSECSSDAEWQEPYRHVSTVTDLQLLDQGNYMANDILAKVDRCSMAVSLEARTPLLDHQLADWVNGLPSEYKLRGGRSKAILRDTIRRHIPGVPDSVLSREKKGFGVPLARWLWGPLSGFVQETLADAPQGLISEEGVRRLLSSSPEANKNSVVLMFALGLARWAQRQPTVPW
jgi:asparagine synthase (glutamine-hydrolysing)